jgi:hypothetical protein
MRFEMEMARAGAADGHPDLKPGLKHSARCLAKVNLTTHAPCAARRIHRSGTNDE